MARDKSQCSSYNIIMSVTLTVTGNRSILESYFQPSLNVDNTWECGLLYFSAYNSIPNINSSNNLFDYGDEGEQIAIPHGSYDLYDLLNFLETHIKSCEIDIKPNNNTLKCSIYCTKTIHFDRKNSVSKILGFRNTKLEANKWYESENSVNIIPLSVIRIECDFVRGSYINGLPSHVIHEFVPNVPSGHRFIEVPKNIIYLPIEKNNISSITIKIINENGDCIDFGKENIQLRLHLRKSKC